MGIQFNKWVVVYGINQVYSSFAKSVIKTHMEILNSSTCSYLHNFVFQLENSFAGCVFIFRDMVFQYCFIDIFISIYETIRFD